MMFVSLAARHRARASCSHGITYMLAAAPKVSLTLSPFFSSLTRAIRSRSCRPPPPSSQGLSP